MISVLSVSDWAGSLSVHNDKVIASELDKIENQCVKFGHSTHPHFYRATLRCTVLVIVILSVRLSHSCTVSTWFDLRS